MQNQHVDAVEVLVRRCELAHLLGRRMDLISTQAHYTKPRIRRTGFAVLNLHIAESVIAEPRMPGLHSAAAQRVRIPLRAPGTSLPRKPILVEKFARDQFHYGTAPPADCDLRPTGKILSQIVDRDSRL